MSLLLQTSCTTDLKTAAANTLYNWSWDWCCKHLAQLISRLLLQIPCTTYLETDVANTLLNWSWDWCCKHLAQLILRLLLQTPCLTDLRPILKSWVWSWEIILKPVLWTKLTTCCSKCLMFLTTVSRLFSGLFWIFHDACQSENSWDLFLNTVLKHVR